MSELEWEEAGQVKFKNLVASVNRSLLGNGNVFHSIRLGRQSKNGKVTQFLQPDDLVHLPGLSELTQKWVSEDVERIRNKKAAG